MPDVEDRLRRELSVRARDPRTAATLPRALGTAAARRRRRDRLALGVAVVALLALVATGVVLRLSGDEDSTPVVTGPDGGGQWVPMAESPLSPRTRALAFAVGDEVLVFGGNPTAGCPPGPDCWLLDGAAYDVGTGEWRTIADQAPDWLASGTGYASGVVIGDRLYLWLETDCSGPAEDCSSAHGGAFLSYDVSDDRWTELAYPYNMASVQTPLSLTTDGRRIVAYQTDATVPLRDPGAESDWTELAYDPAADTWSALPVDTLRPSTNRTIVGHDGDLYLFATLTTGGTHAAVLRSGADEWTALPDPPGPTTFGWFVIGDEIVSPSPGPTAGVPNGDDEVESPANVLDIVSGQWVDPPPMPFDGPGPANPFLAALPVTASGSLIQSGGMVLDVDAGTWTALPATDAIADYGQGTAWVGDTLVVWGGESGSDVSAAGATWTPGPVREPTNTDGTAAGLNGLMVRSASACPPPADLGHSARDVDGNVVEALRLQGLGNELSDATARPHRADGTYYGVRFSVTNATSEPLVPNDLRLALSASGRSYPEVDDPLAGTDRSLSGGAASAMGDRPPNVPLEPGASVVTWAVFDVDPTLRPDQLVVGWALAPEQFACLAPEQLYAG